MSEKCGELIARCFQARTEAHIAHLMTNSYAEHVALQGFYEGLVGLADSFAEAATGRFGILKYPVQCPKVGERSKPVSIPTELRAWIDKNRDGCCEDLNELENIIDGITELCDAAIYKLRFLS